MAGVRLLRRAPAWTLAFLVLLIALSIRVADPGFVEEWRLRGFDAVQRLSPRHEADNGTLIVAIDEEALAAKGQWPWPRTLMAELVGRIADGRPSVLGVDILFAEPDRFSPQRLAETLPGLPQDVAAALARLPANDTVLAEAIARVPTVLVADPTHEAMPAAGPPRRVVAPV